MHAYSATHCNADCVRIRDMPATKTATLNLRIDPGLKKALKIAADREHRSIANLVEVLIREHCTKARIPLKRQAGRPEGTGRNE